MCGCRILSNKYYHSSLGLSWVRKVKLQERIYSVQVPLGFHSSWCLSCQVSLSCEHGHTLCIWNQQLLEFPSPRTFSCSKNRAFHVVDMSFHYFFFSCTNKTLSTNESSSLYDKYVQAYTHTHTHIYNLAKTQKELLVTVDVIVGEKLGLRLFCYVKDQ